MGSWKETAGSLIYGCIIYNNGYLTPSLDLRGHGPGLYIQNRSNKYRVFKNNIVFNNFYIGFECFSASSTASFEFHKNLTFDDNTAFNNGSPYRWNVNSYGDANIVVSNYNQDGTNIIRNVNIINNTLYHSTDYTPTGSTKETVSLEIGGTDPIYRSQNFIVTNNFISGRNNFLKINDIQDLTFKNNRALGRWVSVKLSNNTTINPVEWKFSDNTYFTQNATYSTLHASHKVFRMEIPPPPPIIAERLPLSGEESIATVDRYLDEWQTDFGIDLNSTWADFTLSNNGPLFWWLANINPPNVLKITQNTYKPNQYKVVLFSAPPQSSIVTINFTSHGITIPNGTPYVIRDIENFTQVASSGLMQNNQVQFDLNLSGFNTPQGTDFVNSAQHTPANFGVFLIEFANYSGCEANLTVANALPSGTLDFIQASNSISTSSKINTGSVGIYHAGNSVTLSNGFHSKNGSKFRGYVEGCSQSFVGRVENSDEVKNEKEVIKDVSLDENLKIYPNPNSGIFKIESLKELKIKHVEVYNINNANQVFDKKYNSEKTVSVVISNQPEGLYTVKVLFDDDSSVTKTIIKK